MPDASIEEAAEPGVSIWERQGAHAAAAPLGQDLEQVASHTVEYSGGALRGGQEALSDLGQGAQPRRSGMAVQFALQNDHFPPILKLGFAYAPWERWKHAT